MTIIDLPPSVLIALFCDSQTPRRETQSDLIVTDETQDGSGDPIVGKPLEGQERGCGVDASSPVSPMSLANNGHPPLLASLCAETKWVRSIARRFADGPNAGCPCVHPETVEVPEEKPINDCPDMGDGHLDDMPHGIPATKIPAQTLSASILVYARIGVPMRFPSVPFIGPMKVRGVL